MQITWRRLTIHNIHTYTHTCIRRLSWRRLTILGDPSIYPDIHTYIRRLIILVNPYIHTYIHTYMHTQIIMEKVDYPGGSKNQHEVGFVANLCVRDNTPQVCMYVCVCVCVSYQCRCVRNTYASQCIRANTGIYFRIHAHETYMPEQCVQQSSSCARHHRYSYMYTYMQYAGGETSHALQIIHKYIKIHTKIHKYILIYMNTYIYV
jgi:hypothetical protein